MTPVELISILSPLCIVVLCWKHRFTPIWWYALAGFIADVLSYWVEPKQIVGNLFLLVEFVCFTMYFAGMVFKNTRWSYIVLLVVGGAYVSWLFMAPSNRFQLQWGSIFCMIYIGFSLFSYHHLLRDKTRMKEERTYLFAQTTAIYVYASGCCLLFLFAGSVKLEFLTIVWSTFYLSINIFRYLMTAFALYRKPVYGS